MGAKQSEEVRTFIKLLNNGLTLREAQQGAGIAMSTAYRIKATMPKSVKVVTVAQEQPNHSDNGTIVQSSTTEANHE